MTVRRHRALIVHIFYTCILHYGGSQINVLTFIVQHACSVYTVYIHIIVLYRISFKFIAWVQGVYSPKTGCILQSFLILCGNMFPDIVYVHIVVLYMICFTFTVWVKGVYSQNKGCITGLFFILCGNMFLFQMALHICPVVQ